MSTTRAASGMTAGQFLVWAAAQEHRYELADGVPVAMARAKLGHDRVVVNALASLHGKLRGGACFAFSADTAVLIPNGNVRLPDAGIDCPAFDPEQTHAVAPVLVIEVLSPATRYFGLFRKLEEYKTVPSLCHIMIVNADAAEVIHWQREDAGWTYRTLLGQDAVVTVAAPAFTLPVAELYDGLRFRTPPRLVEDGAGGD